MGKGIEDISHYFISMKGAPGTGAARAVQEAPLKEGIHRRAAVVARTPGIPGFAWSACLALALSYCGKKVILMDIGSEAETLSAYLQSAAIFPSLGALLDQTDKSITKDCSVGFRLLSFQFLKEEFDRFGSEDREILFQMLCREEEQAEIMLSHVHCDLLNPEALNHLRYFDEVILIVPQEEAPETYGLLKVLYHLAPNLRVGLVDTGVSARPGPTAAERLAEAAGRFLGQTPVVLGGIPAVLTESGSQALKLPIQAIGRGDFRGELGAFGRSVLTGLNGPRDGRLLFDLIQSKPGEN